MLSIDPSDFSATGTPEPPRRVDLYRPGDVLEVTRLGSGRWLVEEAKWSGGSRAMHWNRGYDEPDGWLLMIRRVSPGGQSATRSLYQSEAGGRFSNMLGPARVVARWRRVFLP